MFRIILIAGLCLALASLGVAGVHAHLPGVSAHAEPAHAHESESYADSGADLFTVIDSHHVHSHDHDGAIDIDPVTKAFGKLSLFQLCVAGAFLYVVFELLSRTGSQLIRWTPARRPPKRRPRTYILPPAHAPPITAS